MALWLIWLRRFHLFSTSPVIVDRRALLSSQTATFVGTWCCRDSLRHLLCELRNVGPRRARFPCKCIVNSTWKGNFANFLSARRARARSVRRGCNPLKYRLVLSRTCSPSFILRGFRGEKRAPVILNFLAIRKPWDAVRLRDMNIIFHFLRQI